MLYISLLVYLAIVYIRPGEIVPAWVGFPFLTVASAVSAGLALFSLLLHPRAFWRQPVDWFVLLFLAAVLASNPSNGWFGGALFALQRFAPTVFCYFLIRLAVRTPRQLRGVIVTIVLLTVFQAANGIVQRYTGQGLGRVTVLVRAPGEKTDAEADAEMDEEELVDGRDARIRGTGIFNDPNDLAMTLVVAVPFLLSGLFNRGRHLAVRAASLLCLAPIGTALAFTLSRGGLVALAAVVTHYSHRRWGKAAAAAVIIVALAGAAAMSMRVARISSREESAQGRVQAWSAGLQMFKARPILGAGFGQFTDYHEKVAHNSFVHSLAELGLVGAFAFVGLFYGFFLATRARGGDLATDVRESGIGLLTAMMFLSRQYNVVPFTVLALGGSVPPPEAEASADAESQASVGILGLATLLAVTLAAVPVIYVVVRVLAVWSR